jgi:hypothetical protein
VIHRRPLAIPLADAAALAPARRRAVVLRLGALGAVAVLAAALALETRTPPGAAAGAPAHTTTIVLLDLSGSISSAASKTIVHTLRSVAADGAHAGLVVFSDHTQEVVPPSAPARLLLDYVRLFRQPADAPVFENPWSRTFSGGTQIGRGLAAARAAIERNGIGDARVILVSDLFDAPGDRAAMRRELLAYARSPGLELRVAAVPGYDATTAWLVRRVVGDGAFAIGRAPEEAEAGADAAGAGGLPVAAVVLAAAAALAVAAHELLNAPLAWRAVR